MPSPTAFSPPLLPPTLDIPIPKVDFGGVAKSGLAGAFAFAIPALLSHPVHVAATRRAIDPAQYHGTTLRAVAKTVKNGGLGALYSGLGSVKFRAAIKGATLFGSYDLFKSLIPRQDMPLKRTTAHAAAGGLAGLVSCAVMCPLEAATMRRVGRGMPVFGGFGMLLNDLGKIRGVYSGFTRIAAVQAPTWAARFALFDRASAQIKESIGKNPDSLVDLGPANEVVVDAISGVSAGVLGAIVERTLGKLVGTEPAILGGGVLAGLKRSVGIVVLTGVQFTMYGSARRLLDVPIMQD